MPVAHVRSWACTCRATFVITFMSEPGDPAPTDPTFVCPKCGASQRLPAIPGIRVDEASVRVLKV